MLNTLMARFEGEPSLVVPGFEAQFEACLQAVMRNPRADEMLAETAATDDGYWPPADSWKAAYRPYVVRDGILQIPVKGVLLNDFPWAAGYATGYLYIRRAAERGMADPGVKGVALICDTPGGMVAGNFDLVDKLHAMRGAKPIRAFAHEHAYSAGYSIASAADKIVVSRTGGVGSIGVVTGHVDRSKALANAGLKVTFIFAGEHKVDGNSSEPLSADAKARLQARIDALYAVFVSTVARNRGLSEDAVRATKALTFTAAEAITHKLADAIGSLEDEVAAFAADLSAASEDEQMNVDKATHDAAVAAARTEGHEAGRAEGHKAGMTAAHERLTAIVGDDKIKGRVGAAVELAVSSPDMPASAVVSFVEKNVPAPAAAAPAAAGSRLDALMGDPALNSAEPDLKADPDSFWGSIVEDGNKSVRR